MSINDPEGDSYKSAESLWQTVIPYDQFLVVRVDGRAFHTWTRGLDKPWDQAMMDAMDAATIALCAEMSGAFVGYTQSDEISVVANVGWNDQCHWFGGKTQKVASVCASIVTAAFNRQPVASGRAPATFDARVFALSPIESVVGYLDWRRRDAYRNAVNALAHHHLGQRAVDRVGVTTRVAMLADAGIDVASEDPGVMYGRMVRRETYEGTVEYVHKRTGDLMVTDAVRSRWVAGPAIGGWPKPN